MWFNEYDIKWYSAFCILKSKSIPAWLIKPEKVRHRLDNTARVMQDTDVISQVIGNWGRWQLRAVLLIYLCKIPSAWFMACIIFTAPTPRYGEFFCRAPTYIDASFPGTNESEPQWSVLSIATDHAVNNKQSLEVDFCFQHNDTDALCQQFEHSSPFNSLITEFDLVCSKTILIAVTQFFHLFGVLTGGILANKFLELWALELIYAWQFIGLILRFLVVFFVVVVKAHGLWCWSEW